MDVFVSANVSDNYGELLRAKSLAAVLAGTIAGILRVEGVLFGILFYYAAMLSCSALVVFTVPRISDFFAESRGVFTAGINSGLMGFILCWTIAYNVCHIF